MLVLIVPCVIIRFGLLRRDKNDTLQHVWPNQRLEDFQITSIVFVQPSAVRNVDNIEESFNRWVQGSTFTCFAVCRAELAGFTMLNGGRTCLHQG